MNLHAVRWGGMDLITVAEDGDKWRALADLAINLRVVLKAGDL